MVESGLDRVRVDWVKRVASTLLFAMLPLSLQAGTTTYTYDVHGRLTQLESPVGIDVSRTSYTYDAANNRRSVVTQQMDITKPNAPTGLLAVAQASDRIQLSWTGSVDVGGGPVSSYKIYRGGANVGSIGASPYSDTGLGANTAYTYNVSAVDPSNNESVLSNSSSATTPPGADLIPPSVPTGLQGTAVSCTWVNLTWNASTDTGGAGLAGYQVFRGGAFLANSPIPSYSDTGATSAVANYYKVLAYDFATPSNASGFSTEIPVSTPDCIPPGAPGNPTFSAILGSSATASWTAATDNVGVTGYRYSINGGASWVDVGGALSANLTGLSLSTSYTVLVQARDQAGNWGPSGSGSFTTLSTVTDSFGFVGGSSGSPPLSQVTGYGTGMGSLSPHTTSTGKTIIAYWSDLELYFNGMTFSVLSMTTYFRVDGFSANPGAGWLQSISGPGGVTFTGASGTFNYTAGSAVWTWPMAPNFVGATTLTIVHQ